MKLEDRILKNWKRPSIKIFDLKKTQGGINALSYEDVFYNNS
jgi:hypothetical protein